MEILLEDENDKSFLTLLPQRREIFDPDIILTGDQSITDAKLKEKLFDETMETRVCLLFK